jgi:cytidylate kinase
VTLTTVHTASYRRGVANAICISRAAGAGGEEIGHAVAERLGFRYIDEEIIDLAAQRGELDVDTVSSAEERRSMVRRFVDATASSASVLARSYPGDAAAYALVETLGESPQQLIREAIVETAREGNAVIMAHAASHALAGQPGTLRILITGSPQRRADRLVADGQSADDSTRSVKSSDKARAQYLQRFYGIDQELPTHYDLVVNTDNLSVEQAADVILAAAATP